MEEVHREVERVRVPVMVGEGVLPSTRAMVNVAGAEVTAGEMVGDRVEQEEAGGEGETEWEGVGVATSLGEAEDAASREGEVVPPVAQEVGVAPQTSREADVEGEWVVDTLQDREVVRV